MREGNDFSPDCPQGCPYHMMQKDRYEGDLLLLPPSQERLVRKQGPSPLPSHDVEYQMPKPVKSNFICNKKVLLRERKRHTARRVVSTPSVFLSGYPPRPDLGGTLPGYPPWQGTPRQGTPPGWTWQGTPPRCLPHGILGNVAKHYGIWVPPLGVCPMEFWVMLQSIMGYEYPPPGVCPMAFWVMLQSIMGYGYPPQVWTDKQSETITFPSYYVRGR